VPHDLAISGQRVTCRFPCGSWGAGLFFGIIGPLTVPAFLETFFLTPEQVREQSDVIWTFQVVSGLICVAFGLVLAGIWQRIDENR